MENKWKYSKDNPQEALKDAPSKSHESSTEKQSFVDFSAVDVQYQKTDGDEYPSTFVVIFSGGQKTELSYFKRICNNSTYFPNIRINILVEDCFRPQNEQLKFDPLIFDFACENVKNYQAGAHPDKPDTYYLLTDVDHFREAIIHYKSQCEENKINVIVSNPCFEVWLYYARFSDMFVDFVAPVEIEKISSALKSYMHKKFNSVHTTDLIFDIRKNIINSRAVYQVDESDLPIMYTTNMHELAQNILPYIEDGLEKLFNINQQKRQAKHL